MKYDVIIIGSGISGLRTAKIKLTKRNNYLLTYFF
jgi:flavin-dependent dehydrogenase